MKTLLSKVYSDEKHALYASDSAAKNVDSQAASMIVSVLEMSYAREYHHHAGLVAKVYGFLIFD